MNQHKENFTNRAIEMMKNYDRGNIEKARIKADRMWDNIFKEIGNGGGVGPDPDPDPIARNELLQLDGMGIFLWFQLGWWNPDTRQQRIEEARETLEFFVKLGYDAVNFFTWLNTGTWDNAHFDHLCPYPREGGLFQLDQIKVKWLESFEAWHTLLKSVGIDPLGCDFMARYCWKPFEQGNNTNGVRGFFDPEAMQHQVRLACHINDIEQSVWNNARMGRRPINEVTHRGYLPGVIVPPDRKPDDYKLHVVHDWLQAYYEEGLEGHVAVKHILHDVTGTEADPWVEQHQCPKCDTRTLGNDRFLDSNDHRQHNRVVHTVTLVDDIQPSGYYIWLGSGWVYVEPGEHVHFYGQDGGTRYKEKARGCKLRKPDGTVIWAQGDAEQTFDCTRKIVKDAVDHGPRQFRAGVQVVCLEALAGSWPMVEDWRLSVLHKDRIIAAAQAVASATG